MKKLYYTYEFFKKDVEILVDKCRLYDTNVLLAVARGGLTLSHFMAQALHIRALYTLNSIHYDGEVRLDTFNIFNIPDISHSKKVLIVDDIEDSGETIREILKVLNEKFPNVEFRLATLFYKKTAVLKPDYYIKEANQWIDFFWEVDVK